jgi:hypothetical protein
MALSRGPKPPDGTAMSTKCGNSCATAFARILLRLTFAPNHAPKWPIRRAFDSLQRRRATSLAACELFAARRLPYSRADLARERWFPNNLAEDVDLVPGGNSMPNRRRLVFVQTQNERKNAGFTVDERATAVDVSLRVREVGWTPYKVRLESDAWIAIVIDWQRAA